MATFIFIGGGYLATISSTHIIGIYIIYICFSVGIILNYDTGFRVITTILYHCHYIKMRMFASCRYVLCAHKGDVLMAVFEANIHSGYSRVHAFASDGVCYNEKCVYLVKYRPTTC